MRSDCTCLVYVHCTGHDHGNEAVRTYSQTVHNSTTGPTTTCCYKQAVGVTSTFCTEVSETVPNMCSCIKWLRLIVHTADTAELGEHKLLNRKILLNKNNFSEL